MWQPMQQPYVQRLSLRRLKIAVFGTAQQLIIAMMGLALLTSSTAQAGQHLYRFLNAEGRVEISHAVPVERVALGYEVLDASSGRVVQVIDAQKSQQEVDRISRESQARNECEAALARVNSMYQSELDIEWAHDQAIESLAGRIVSAQLNLRQALDQKRHLEASAAQLERSGKSLDATLVNNIRRTDVQVENLEREIVQRGGEQDQTHERFAEDLALFQQANCSQQAAQGVRQSELAKVVGGDS